MKPLEIEFHYRLISTPSWQVQSFHGGKWVTMWYCKDEASAKLRLWAQIERLITSAKLTDEDRRALCLRAQEGSE